MAGRAHGQVEFLKRSCMIRGERTGEHRAAVLHIGERDFDVGRKALDELADVIELAAEAGARSVVDEQHQFDAGLRAAEGLPGGDLALLAVHLNRNALLGDIRSGSVGFFGHYCDDGLSLALILVLREGGRCDGEKCCCENGEGSNGSVHSSSLRRKAP